LALDLEANCSLDQDLDNVKESDCDRDFDKFTKRTKDESAQIVRYDRGNEPLWVIYKFICESTIFILF
jgi:hypothetical protein